MLVLRVDDACFQGVGPRWEAAVQRVRKKFTICDEEFDDFIFPERRVVQNKNFEITIDQHDYVKALTNVTEHSILKQLIESNLELQKH